AGPAPSPVPDPPPPPRSPSRLLRAQSGVPAPGSGSAARGEQHPRPRGAAARPRRRRRRPPGATGRGGERGAAAAAAPGEAGGRRPPGAGQSSGSGGTPPGPSEGRRGGSERARGEAGAVGGDKPETRSVCGSDSGSDSNPGGAGPICKICFQGAEQGELLNPCRCDGSVRYTHQLCLLKWISERGSWTCELCCYRYHVIAIKMKKPCQWQSITITLVEKVQMIAVILGSLFLVASVTWLLWSAFSPYAVWQRKDILFQICYGMYGFMDLVCIGLIVHEGASVYRVFKRWRAVNLHWDVLNYDKATDIEESNRGASSPGRTLWLPLTAFRNRSLIHPTQLTSPRFQCGYVLLHLFNRMRPHEDSSEDNSSGEVVMRVTSV
uniref:RING-type E3 ubiquitin transferase n=1 Tax=Chrysemys picta bellii TaxID=8478 RepID=A0A8C3I934_CHRPI